MIRNHENFKILELLVNLLLSASKLKANLSYETFQALDILRIR